MTFLEIFQVYILPTVAVLSGLTALIVFIFTRPDREVTRKKVEAEVDKILSERNKEMQDYWHDEFDRLNKKIDRQEEKINSQDQKIISLETDVKGRDLTIKELTEENSRIKRDYEKMEIKNAQLEERIKVLEELLKKYGIDLDEAVDCDE